MKFPATTLSAEEVKLRDEVRHFLQEESSVLGSTDMAIGRDPAFSRRLAARGWVGMVIPPQYGGRGSSAVERYLVTAELLAAGAPVVAHWVADRQTAPTLLAFGSEQLKQELLPAITRADVQFCIGMSEPDAGSDLSAVRTSAARVDGGWSVTGRKLWTSGADTSDLMLTLVRTDRGSTRHEGLSQLIVDLRTPGVLVRPIVNLAGRADFCEVVLDEVFVADERVLGEPGEGWAQVTSELAHERSGADRWLSTYGVFRRFVRECMNEGDPEAALAIGRIAAHYRVLYHLSLSVARVIDGGGSAAAQAALVKDLGTVFEKDVVEIVRALAELPSDGDDSRELSGPLLESVLDLPSLTVRGGTTELLRSVVAKDLLR